MSDEPTGAYDTGGSAFDATPKAAGLRQGEPTSTPAVAKISQEMWDRVVGEWLNSHVRSSPITQGTSGAWEHLNAALPRLKELLEREL